MSASNFYNHKQEFSIKMLEENTETTQESTWTKQVASIAIRRRGRKVLN